MIRVLFIIISFYLCLINTKMVFAIEAQNKKDIMVFTELNIAINNQDPILINVLKLIEISGLTSDVLFTPWNRAYELAQTTTNSIIFPMYKTPGREKLFHWLCPITPPNSKYLYRLSSRTDLHLESLAEIGPSTVGVVKNDMIHSHLLTLPTKFNLDATAYDTTNINKLLKGRVDYIAESEDTVLSYLISPLPTCHQI